MERDRAKDIQKQFSMVLTKEEIDSFLNHRFDVGNLSKFFSYTYLKDHFKEFADYFYTLRATYPCFVPLYDDKGIVYLDNNTYFYHASLDKARLANEKEEYENSRYKTLKSDTEFLEKDKILNELNDDDIIFVKSDSFESVIYRGEDEVMRNLVAEVMNNVIKFESQSHKMLVYETIEDLIDANSHTQSEEIKEISKKEVSFKPKSGAVLNNDLIKDKGINLFIYKNCIKGSFNYTNAKGESKTSYRIKLPIKDRYISFTLPEKCIKPNGKDEKTVKMYLPKNMSFKLSELNRDEHQFKDLKTVDSLEIANLFDDMSKRISAASQNKANDLDNSSSLKPVSGQASPSFKSIQNEQKIKLGSFPQTNTETKRNEPEAKEKKGLKSFLSLKRSM